MRMCLCGEQECISLSLLSAILLLSLYLLPEHDMYSNGTWCLLCGVMLRSVTLLLLLRLLLVRLFIVRLLILLGLLLLFLLLLLLLSLLLILLLLLLLCWGHYYHDGGKGIKQKREGEKESHANSNKRLVMSEMFAGVSLLRAFMYGLC